MRILWRPGRGRLEFLCGAGHLGSTAPFGASSFAMSDLLFDLAYVAMGLAFLGGTMGYAHLCERL